MNFWISTIFGAVFLTVVSAQSLPFNNAPGDPPGYYTDLPTDFTGTVPPGWELYTRPPVYLDLSEDSNASASPPSEGPSESPAPPPEQCSSQPPQNCGACSAQPVVINLSCGGGNDGGRRPSYPQRPPPQTPPPFMTSAAPAFTFDPEMCNMNEQGYPTKPELYPQGYHMTLVDGVPTPIVPPGYPRPPPNWDGDLATLGFPAPQPGTIEYNVIMCWPIAVPVGRR